MLAVQVHADFFAATIRALTGRSDLRGLPVLDLGCGDGQLVEALGKLGLDSYGCDLVLADTDDRLRVIKQPYRLPFGDTSMDAVVSTGVLEHVQNPTECFYEVARILRPGGLAMHLYPGRWYLPYEPHIYVPLVNYMWAHVPRWWLQLWAILGVRNRFQRGLGWRATAEANAQYCGSGIAYRSTRHYRRLSLDIFDRCEWPMGLYIAHAPGGTARLARRLPFRGLVGLLCREARMGLLVQYKGA